MKKTLYFTAAVAILLFSSLAAAYLQFHNVQLIGGGRWQGTGEPPYQFGYATKHIVYGTPFHFARFDVENEVISSEIYNKAEEAVALEKIDWQLFLADVILYSGAIALFLFLYSFFIKKLLIFLWGDWRKIFSLFAIALSATFYPRFLSFLFIFGAPGYFLAVILWIPSRLLPGLWAYFVLGTILLPSGFQGEAVANLGLILAFLINFIFFVSLYLLWQLKRKPRIGAAAS